MIESQTIYPENILVLFRTVLFILIMTITTAVPVRVDVGFPIPRFVTASLGQQRVRSVPYADLRTAKTS